MLMFFLLVIFGVLIGMGDKKWKINLERFLGVLLFWL